MCVAQFLCLSLCMCVCCEKLATLRCRTSKDKGCCCCSRRRGRMTLDSDLWPRPLITQLNWAASANLGRMPNAHSPLQIPPPPPATLYLPLIVRNLLSFLWLFHAANVAILSMCNHFLSQIFCSISAQLSDCSESHSSCCPEGC